MMKKLAAVWLLLSGLVAVVTTILQIEPAATIIEITQLSDGSFYILLPLAGTFILGAMPLFMVMLINNFIQNKKNKMPVDLTGKTGIVIKRERELPNAAIRFGVFVNGDQMATVGVGKKIFVELPLGEYRIQTKLGKKMYSPEVVVQLEQNKIIAFQTKSDLSKSLTTLVAKGEMLFLVQVPFSK